MDTPDEAPSIAARALRDAGDYLAYRADESQSDDRVGLYAAAGIIKARANLLEPR